MKNSVEYNALNIINEMTMFNKVLIGIGILLSSILIIENSVIPGQAYLLVWYSRTGVLAAVCIFIGAMIGFGLKGMLTEQDDDEFDY